jgi:hypothetical protein
MFLAQSLRGYRELVGDLGGNPTRLKARQIQPVPTNRLTAFMSFERLIDLLECTADDLAAPTSGQAWPNA